ncbi:hypothetical protein FD723_41605 (plasmid) [Nostoc sp. C052]|uniref:hypothetical protein n=1 Tax=Nostoc sp. C052 TaxID=2576902 RepID=UPI0015C3A393|nr:hypothetical protein [Nostoc sp. C052]QLE46673.1 hypothetical protein FD723_41540 [Nostoc sp. C052]QLE46686.1 hypothetical protein FD723_41605 [Nostoc sp. C052]
MPKKVSSSKSSSKKAFNHKHSSKIPPRSQLFSLLIELIADRRLTESVEILENAGYNDNLVIFFILANLQYEVAV